MQEKLLKPFSPDQIEWRISRAGHKKDGEIWAIVLPYVTSRAIQQRLDMAVGFENWRDSLEFVPGEGFISTIFIRINGEWVGKSDVAPLTNVEAFKGGSSDAFKRAAVKWGMGRYLYALDKDFWAEVTTNGAHNGSFKDKDKKTIYFKWNEPELPKWAIDEIDMSLIPKEIADFFRALKYTTGEVKSFCEMYQWNFDVMKQMINQQEENPQ